MKMLLINYMWYWLGIGNEKESFLKIVKFIKNPVKFFEKDKSSSEQAIDVATLIARINYLLCIPSFLIEVKDILQEMTLMNYASLCLFLLFIFLSLKIITGVVIELMGMFYNYFIKLITKKDNLVAAERVLAYSSIFLLLNYIPIIGSIASLLVVVLHVIGIYKQYKLPLGISVVCAFAFEISLFLLSLIFIALFFFSHLFV